jgi:hypothetical protein
VGPVFFFAATAVAFLLLRAYGEQSERGRAATRRIYANANLWQGLRGSIALAPVWFVGSLLLAIAGIFPRFPGAILGMAAIDICGLAFFLSYRVPQPMMPRWLADDIHQGTTQLAEPDRLDWILFWLVLLVGVIGNVALVLLLTVFPAT